MAKSRTTPHHQKRTPEALAALVYQLSETANVSAAARAIGVSRDLAYHWYKKSKEGTLDAPSSVALVEGEDPLPLHEAWDSSLEVATDHLEATALMLATGYDEPVVYQGRIEKELDPDTMEMVPVTIRRYSERMLEILLKARRPEVYRERHQVEHKGDVKGLLIVPGVMEPEAWEEMARKQQAKARGEE